VEVGVEVEMQLKVVSLGFVVLLHTFSLIQLN
jgi:hypothetical protein